MNLSSNDRSLFNLLLDSVYQESAGMHVRERKRKRE